MMICGVAAEYNPFHNGHALHLARARAETGAEAVICVMSGNFVQRGEPAVVGKRTRTRMALAHGADMVLELPVPYATAAAERFAYGAVAVLSACGIVNAISFGSESGDLPALSAMAAADEDDAFRARLHAGLREGRSFPIARDMASADGVASAPNDILAVEYLRAVRRQNAPLMPHTLRREGAGYHDAEVCGALASATAVRAALLRGDADAVRAAMPASTAEWLLTETPVTANDLSQAFHYALRTIPREKLMQIADISEGLENRILAFAEAHYALSDLAMAVKTKRYTLARVRRALLHILLQTDASAQCQPPPYIRVLGFRRDRERLLGRLCAEAALPVVTNLKNARTLLNDRAYALLADELRAGDIYRLAAQSLGHRIPNERSEPMEVI